MTATVPGLHFPSSAAIGRSADSALPISTA